MQLNLRIDVSQVSPTTWIAITTTAGEMYTAVDYIHVAGDRVRHGAGLAVGDMVSRIIKSYDKVEILTIYDDDDLRYTTVNPFIEIDEIYIQLEEYLIIDLAHLVVDMIYCDYGSEYT